MSAQQTEITDTEVIKALKEEFGYNEEDFESIDNTPEGRRHMLYTERQEEEAFIKNSIAYEKKMGIYEGKVE